MNEMMNNPDYPHLIREEYYLNEMAQEKLNEQQVELTHQFEIEFLEAKI